MQYFLGIDVGGTWIKAISVPSQNSFNLSTLTNLTEPATITKVKSRLSNEASPDDFINALQELLDAMEISLDAIAGIGISTAGIVNYHGTRLERCAPHLRPLQSDKWVEFLQAKTKCPIVMINDADAVAIGSAVLGYIHGNKCYGVMPVGTGIGFSVIRNSRKWTPNFSLTLLGSIYAVDGSFDRLGSASYLAKQAKDGMLQSVFLEEEYRSVKEEYLSRLAGIIASAHTIYGVNHLLLGGGLADAGYQYGYEAELIRSLKQLLDIEHNLREKDIVVELLKEGNRLPLIGALMLISGEIQAQKLRHKISYEDIGTEKAYNSLLHLDKVDTLSLLMLLNTVEQEAGEKLTLTLPRLANVVDVISEKLKQGGRLIYVGCGTSGRLAAVDTVEIACTFGFPRDKVLTFISGGIADASIDIETRFEEDASAVPEMLMANISDRDVVIGISVSGTAYYVQSALGLSKALRATTIMIQEKEVESASFCDFVLPLNSGAELIAGSTRMKAGTATKKVLNFLSTSVMVKLHKVHGSFMTELECINEKLMNRAIHILCSLYEISHEQAFILLRDNEWKLNRAIEKMNQR